MTTLVEKINQAWGFVYSETKTDLPHMYLTDYKGTFWYAARKGGLNVSDSSSKKESLGSKMLSTIVQRKLFKIKLIASPESEGSSVFPEDDDRIFIVPKQKDMVIVDGTPLSRDREILKGSCHITIPDYDLDLIFEAFYDVSARRGLRKLGPSYRFISKLGKGGYGAVYKGLRVKNEKICAIKTLLDPHEDDLMDEYKMLKNLKHANVIKMLDFKSDRHHQFLMTELARGGSLYYRVFKGQKVSESAAQHIFKQVSAAIAYLHKLGIIHRDLKPENIVLMTPDDLCPAKVIDFGLSCYLNDEEEMEYVAGAYRYMSPEMLAKKIYRRVKDVSYGKPIDVWGVGLCYFIALTKTEPYEYSKDLGEYLDRMRAGKMETGLAAYAKLSKHTKKVLNQSLQIDPKKRCKIKELLELIKRAGTSDELSGNL